MSTDRISLEGVASLDRQIEIPGRWIADGDLNAKLLAIALEQLPKPKPMRRSQLARRDYVPEVQAALPKPKKNLLKGLRCLLVPIAILGVLAIGASAVKAYSDWFNANFAYGVVKTAPNQYHGLAVGDVVEQEPLPDGRTVKVLCKGHLPSVSQLPSIANSQMGDMWFTEKDGNCWVLTTLTATSSTVGWVDP